MKDKGEKEMTTKEQFLNNIAKNLGRERRTGVKAPTFETNPWDQMYKEFSQEDYIEFYIENLTALSGNTVRVSNIKELEVVIKGIITDEKAKTAIMWKDSRIQELSLYEALINNGVEAKEWDTKLSKKEQIDFAEQADLGFTFADIGLAETGSILLFNQGDKGRSVSLLPRVFVTFLRTKDIKPRITSALKHIHEKHEQEGLPSLINFITGPSRSADIEMSLSIGVHGPGKIYVILLDY